jgi:hypothetical protein
MGSKTAGCLHLLIPRFSRNSRAAHFLCSGWMTGNPEVMTASEVKSHSSIDRFLVVFHSPSGMAETGLLACRSEKTGRASRCNANTKDFLWSGLPMKTSELAGISRDFRGTTRRISLHSRLCGGERRIRTLGTVFLNLQAWTCARLASHSATATYTQRIRLASNKALKSSSFAARETANGR